jgi:hypothetical protein
LPGPGINFVDVDPAAVVVELGRLTRVAKINVLRTFAGWDLPPHFNPGSKIVIPGNVSLTPLHLTGANLGWAFGSDQHAPGRGRGLGKSGKDFDAQPTTGQRLNSIEPSFVEIDGGTTAIDPDWSVGKSKLGDLENDRSVGQKYHGALGLGVPAVGNGIETQCGVLVEPHKIGVGKNDLHPGFTSGVDPIATHQRHIDDRLQAFLLVDWHNGRIALEVWDVAQRGHFVLARGHRDAAEC